MKTIIKRTALFLSSVFVAASAFCLTAAAAGATISFSSNSPTVNQAVTVSVTVNTDEAMYATQFTVNYDPAVMRFDSGDNANGGAGVVNVVASPAGTKKQTFSLKFTAIAAGSSSVRVTDAMYATDVEKPLNGATAKLVVSDAKKSSNANLKSLSLSVGTLSPRFSQAVTSYTASVPFDATECKIYATAADSAAKVEVSGKAVLDAGNVTRTVTVTAAGGAQKTYTIAITKLSEEKKDDTSSVAETSGTTVIDDVRYSIATDISAITLPEGFKAGTADYGGTTVATAQDEDSVYTLYYLKSEADQNYNPYVLDKDGETFTKLKYIVNAGKFYIFADFPSNRVAEEEYYKTNVEIGGFSAECYANNNPEMSDFCYIYCFSNNAFNIYRYDKKFETLQREPVFKLLSPDEVEIAGVGLAKRFTMLSTNAKVIVICLLVAALGVLALVILLIVKIARGNHVPIDDLDEDMFFSTDFDGVFIEEEEPNNMQKEQK